MDLAYRSEAKRSSALAVVVVFLAVLFAVSQFAPRRDAAAPSAHTDGAVARLKADIVRIRAAAALIRHRTLKGTPLVLAEVARFVDDVDTPSLSLRVRARLIDHAAGAVVGVCEECFEILQASRPTRIVDGPKSDQRGMWARKMIGFAP